MKIKRALLVALIALGLSLGVVGSKPSSNVVDVPAIAGAKRGIASSTNPVEETVTAGRKPGVSPGIG